MIGFVITASIHQDKGRNARVEGRCLSYKGSNQRCTEPSGRRRDVIDLHAEKISQLNLIMG